MSDTNYNPALPNGKPRTYFNEEVNPHGIVPHYESGDEAKQKLSEVLKDAKEKLYE